MTQRIGVASAFPDFGPNLSEIESDLVEIDLGPTWSKLAEVGPTLANFGPDLVELGTISAESGPMCVEIGANLGQI